LIITDAAISIAPLEERWTLPERSIWRGRRPRASKVAILAAETVQDAATIDAAALQNGRRGQIKGGMLGGPLAFDNAISRDAAKMKARV
jgi:phosphotransacetylase